MITDPTRVCQLLVGLPDVAIEGAWGQPAGPVEIFIETRDKRPDCGSCGQRAVLKDRSRVALVDLPCFGRPARLLWNKRRWVCRATACGTGSWTETNNAIAPARLAMTNRAAKWATVQVGRFGRAVSDVAAELGCDWHTVNDAVITVGRALLATDGARIGRVTALGLDETLFGRFGAWRTQSWATSIVDVDRGVLIDVVQERTALAATTWLAEQPQSWLDAICWATLDLSGPYRAAFNTMIPTAVQVADPFHVVKLANRALDEVRRRVQAETLGHRGRKDDPLYRSRRLLTKAHERLDTRGETKLWGLLEAGDPTGEVRMAWHAKETIRGLYEAEPHDAAQYLDELTDDLCDPDVCPPEINTLGRTLARWRSEILAWHHARVTNGPTEAANNLIKRIKRIGFGFRRFTNYRIRALLYAGQPNWDLLDGLTPR